MLMTFQAHLMPPAPDCFARKPSGVVVNTYTHPALVFREIVDTIGNGFAQVFIDKVMDQHFDWLAFRLPFGTSIAKFADHFLLFRVNRNRRLVSLLKVLNSGIDVF